MPRTASRAKLSNGAAKSRPNGRILTVKQLDKRSYDSVHRAERGKRGPIMKALLKAWADYASFKVGATEQLLAGDLRFSHKDA